MCLQIGIIAGGHKFRPLTVVDDGGVKLVDSLPQSSVVEVLEWALTAGNRASASLPNSEFGCIALV